MQVSLETTGSLERRMTVEIPAERITAAVEQKLQDMSRRVKVSGFRPGKVPLGVVRQRFGKQVFQEVIADTMYSSYREAVLQEKLRPAGSPRIEPLNVKINQNLTYIATFEVYPEMNLADISKLEIQVADVEVAASDINNMLDKLRAQKTRWKEVDREANKNDRVTLDFKGTIEGETFPGGSNDNFPVILGSNTLIPEFEEQLYGVRKNEEKSFDVTFPKDYAQQQLAKKTATFAIHVKMIESGELPDPDEAFVKEFGIEDGNVDTLKEQLKNNLDIELTQRKKAFNKDQVMRRLLAANEFEIPHSLLQREIQALREQATTGVKTKHETELPDTMFAEQAKRRTSLGLIIGEIAHLNKIKLDNQKVNDHINTIASGCAKPEDVMQHYRSNRQAMASIESIIMEEQVVEWVLGQARKTPVSLTFDEIINMRF